MTPQTSASRQKIDSYFFFLAKGKTFTFKGNEFPKAVQTARNICFNVPYFREVGVFEVEVFKQGEKEIKEYCVKAYIRAKGASAFYDKTLWKQLKEVEKTGLQRRS